ncbi:MAG: DUF2062 domain-containing protein [Leptolyngbyaceae bacterium]|nr:DUF2062 domain-containing protein [Leptolyngbyaceae bacterium]
MNLKRGLRYIYLRFIRLKGTPAEISLGLAIGVFWGMFPLPGLQMAIAILTAALLQGSKLAAAAGTWLSNPLTTLPLTALNFHIGQLVLGRDLEDLPEVRLQSLEGIQQLGSEFLSSYLLGCLIVGTVTGTATYIAGVPIVKSIQHRALRRRMSRRNGQARIS